MFTTNTNDIKPNSNGNSNSNNSILKDNTEEMENDIDRSTAALTALTIEEDTTNNEASNNISNSTDATLESYEIVNNVRYGKCKWFNVAKGWGFITPNDGGQEVFVHQSVIQMSGFRSLGEQEDVEFECHLTERGLEATRVSGRQGTDCHGSTFRPRTKKRNRRVRCYNCGEFANHIASKCHLEPQPKRCHLCKRSDHLFANCPTNKNQKNTSVPHSINSTAGTNINDDGQEETFKETS